MAAIKRGAQSTPFANNQMPAGLKLAKHFNGLNAEREKEREQG